jgi:hypothetical protein
MASVNADMRPPTVRGCRPVRPGRPPNGLAAVPRAAVPRAAVLRATAIQALVHAGTSFTSTPLDTLTDASTVVNMWL